MDDFFKEQLETANKLIFVRAYSEAEQVLNDALESPGHERAGLLHLRRIELKSLLGKLDELKDRYARESSRKNQPETQFYHSLTRLFLGEDVEELVSVFKGFVSHRDLQAMALFALGYAAEQLGQFEKSKQLYQKSISDDPTWYPSYFGMSQVLYQLGEDTEGDQIFQQFESMAPYNVYGNFETHKSVSQQFLAEKRFKEAEDAVQILSSWWVDNKGYCPAEIDVYVLLSSYRISLEQKSIGIAEEKKYAALDRAKELLKKPNVDERVLYFLARILDEFGESVLALEAYTRLMEHDGQSSHVIKKVGAHFFGHKSTEETLKLFESAYKKHPDHPEVRFCYLVAQLRAKKIPVEEYLKIRDRMKLAADSKDHVNLMSLLSQMLGIFADDPEVHFQFGSLFSAMDHHEKSDQHMKSMMRCDSEGSQTKVRYANHLVQRSKFQEALDVLSSNRVQIASSSDVFSDVTWLRVRCHDALKQHAQVIEFLRPLLDKEPWSIPYLIQEVVSLTALKQGSDVADGLMINWFNKLLEDGNRKISWKDFDRDTEEALSQHSYRLAFARQKIRFLYAKGQAIVLKELVRIAALHDASTASREIMRLLNTNFDTPSVYWALGLLYKELWQLEVSSMWFEHALFSSGADDKLRGRVYADLADTYCWRNINLPKAVEYSKMVIESQGDPTEERRFGMRVLAHALLRMGQPQQAASYLEHLKSEAIDDYEVHYLTGLISYRNGYPKQANLTWKPLLKHRAESMRDHKIKQEILKYYFEGTEYKAADLSKAN